MSFKLNNYTIGRDVFIIAEIGSTHCASLEKAKYLIDCCIDAKVDCVKFQKRDIQSLLTKKEREREYTSPNSMGKTYGEHREVMEFSEQQFYELNEYCEKKNIMMTASGWDKKSIDFLDSLNVPFFKVASADLTNLPLLKHIAQKRKPIFLSTGMGDINDVLKAVREILIYEKRIVLLQCTSSYPCPFEQINLNVFQQYKALFPNLVFGYSGHEKGFVIPCVAVGMGAKVIEKHITFDKNARGSDHKAALDIPELYKLTKNIRNTELALGNSNKEIQVSERDCIKKLCKSIVSTRPIASGEIILEDMITTKSPGDGLPAKMFYKIIGKRITKSIKEDETLTEEHFNN